MLCYKDKTWCVFKDCKKFNKCEDALTDKVKLDALKWWGKSNAPIAVYSEKPNCYKGVEDGTSTIHR